MPGTHTNPQRIRALEQVSMVRTRQIQLSLHHITAAIDRHPRNDPRFALDIPTSFNLIMRRCPISLSRDGPATVAEVPIGGTPYRSGCRQRWPSGFGTYVLA